MIEPIMPLVSVVIPFFNAEIYLKETIESVINQDYTDWELILIDDGSSDSSTSIAKEYAEKYLHKIFYAEHEGHINKAAAATRNLGITKARAEIVALLYADYLWLPQYLQQQMKILQANPQISMLCEASRYWYSWNNPAAKDIDIAVGAVSERLYPPLQLARELYPLGVGAAPCPCSIIIKKSVIEAINGFEESFVGKYQVFEDQAFLIKVYLHEAVYISSNCNNLYRQRPGSVMDTMATQGLHNEAHYFFLQWLDNYLNKKKIDDEVVRRLLKKAFRVYNYPLADRVIKSISSRWKLLTKQLT